MAQGIGDDNRTWLYQTLKSQGLGDDILGSEEDFYDGMINREDNREWAWNTLQQLGIGEDITGDKESFMHDMAYVDSPSIENGQQGSNVDLTLDDGTPTDDSHMVDFGSGANVGASVTDILSKARKQGEVAKERAEGETPGTVEDGGMKLNDEGLAVATPEVSDEPEVSVAKQTGSKWNVEGTLYDTKEEADAASRKMYDARLKSLLTLGEEKPGVVSQVLYGPMKDEVNGIYEQARNMYSSGDSTPEDRADFINNSLQTLLNTHKNNITTGEDNELLSGILQKLGLTTSVNAEDASKSRQISSIPDMTDEERRQFIENNSDKLYESARDIQRSLSSLLKDSGAPDEDLAMVQGQKMTQSIYEYLKEGLDSEIKFHKELYDYYSMDENKISAGLDEQISGVDEMLNESIGNDMVVAANNVDLIAFEPGLGNVYNRDSRKTQTLRTASRLLSDSREMLDAYKRYKESGSKDSFQSFAKDFGISFFNGAKDIRTWDFGISSLGDAVEIKSVLDKDENNEPLTTEERALLDAIAMNGAIQLYYGESGMGNDVGRTVIEMIPLMAEMAINPASGLGNATGRSFGKYLLKNANRIVRKFGKDAAGASAKNILFNVGKYSGKLAGSVLGGAIMSGTTGLARTTEDAISRATGTPNAEFDVKGNPVITSYEEGDDAFTAIGKAVINNTAQYGTEILGFEPLANIFKGAATGLLGERGLGKLARNFDALGRLYNGAVKHLSNIRNSDLSKLFKKFNDLTHYDGIVNEYGEEVLNNIVSASIGDMEWDASENGIFNAKTNLTTALSVAVPGFVQSAIATGHYAAARGKAASDVSMYGKKLSPSLRSKLSSLDYSLSNDELSDIVTAIALNEGGGRVVDAARYVIANKTIYELDNAKPLVDEFDAYDLDVASKEVQEEGMDALGISGKEYELGKDMGAALDAINGIEGGDRYKGFVDDYVNGRIDALELNSRMEGLDDNTISVVRNYIVASEKMKGVREGIESQVKNEVDYVVNELQPYADEDGNVTTANINGEDVYITGYSERTGTLYVQSIGEDGSIVVNEVRVDDSFNPNSISVRSVDDYAAEVTYNVRNVLNDDVQFHLQHNPNTQRITPDAMIEIGGETPMRVKNVNEDGTADLVSVTKQNVDGEVVEVEGKDVVTDTIDNLLAAQDAYYDSLDAESEEPATESQGTAGETSGNAEGTEAVTVNADEVENARNILASTTLGEQLVKDLENGDERSFNMVRDGYGGEDRRRLEDARRIYFDSLNAPKVQTENTAVETAGTVAGEPKAEPSGTETGNAMRFDKKGNPDFVGSGVETSTAFLFDEAQSGLSEQEAIDFINDNADEARKTLDKVSKAKLPTDFAKRKAMLEDRRKAMEAYDFWNGMRDGVKTAKAQQTAEAMDAVQAERKRQAELNFGVTPNAVGQAVVDKWNGARKVDGTDDTITLPNNEQVNGHYVVVESGAVTPSHTSTGGFVKSQGYPVNESGETVNDRDYEKDKAAQEHTISIAQNYDNRAIQTPVIVTNDGVVLSGNGRTMAGELAAKNGTDTAYVDYLKEHAERYGIKREDIEGMQHPRLVFVTDEQMPYTTETLAKFNAEEKKSQSATEKGIKGGKLLDNTTYNRLLNDVNGYDTLNDFYASRNNVNGILGELINSGVITAEERAGLMDGDSLTEEGKRLFEMALLGKAFENDPDTLRKIAAYPNMRRSVLMALTAISNNVTFGENSLRDDIIEAVDLVYNARNTGIYKAGDAVSDFASQGNLFESITYGERAILLADVINGRKVSELRDVINRYNVIADNALRSGGDMFGNLPTDREGIWNETLTILKYRKDNGQNSTAGTEGNAEDIVAQSGNGNSTDRRSDLAKARVGTDSYGYTEQDYLDEASLNEQYADELKRLSEIKDDDEFENAANEFEEKLPTGFGITVDKDNVCSISLSEPTVYYDLHGTRRHFKIGDTIQIGYDGRMPHLIVTRVDENGKVLEAIDKFDGRLVIENGERRDINDILDEPKRISEEVNQDGSHFMTASDGSLDFGEITADRNLTPAPIRMVLGDTENGYIHIEMRHGEQIRKNGFKNVYDFIEHVLKNYNIIRKGDAYENSKGGKNQTYYIQLTDEHNNTVFIQMSRDDSYWNINSAGVFSSRYGKNKENIWSASEVQNGGSATTDNASQSESNADGDSTSNGTASNVSNSKGSENVGNNQINSEKKSNERPEKAEPKEVDVASLFGALKENGEAKLSDHYVEDESKEETKDTDSAKDEVNKLVDDGISRGCVFGWQYTDTGRKSYEMVDYERSTATRINKSDYDYAKEHGAKLVSEAEEKDREDENRFARLQDKFIKSFPGRELDEVISTIENSDNTFSKEQNLPWLKDYKQLWDSHRSRLNRITSDGKAYEESSGEAEGTGAGTGTDAGTEEERKKAEREARKQALRDKIKRGLGKLNFGIDPETMLAALELTAMEIEDGVIKFPDYCKRMIETIGDEIRHYLKSFYESVRRMPEAENFVKDMDSTDFVDKFDVANFDKKTIDPIRTAEEKVAEKKVSENVAKIQENNVSLYGDLFSNELNTEDNGKSEGGGHSENENSGRGEENGQEVRRPESGRAGGLSVRTASNDEAGDQGVDSNGRSEETDGELEPSEKRNLNNNHSERGTDYAPSTPVARYNANVDAIRLSQELTETGQQATPEQKEILRRYSGFGGLGSFLNNEQTSKELRDLVGDDAFDEIALSANDAYYTPAYVSDTMWDIVSALGFKGGNILEGSAGIGNIIGLMPQNISERSDIQAIEKDTITGRILALLYPDAKVDIQGFEETNIPNNSVDLAITNVPFVTGLHVVDTTGDRDLSKRFRNIHDFCIAKNVRKLRQGGIAILITSKGTLDNSKKLRDWVVGEGSSDFIGAFRMNNETFGGTPVTSDIIVIRKRVGGEKSPNAINVSDAVCTRTVEYDTGEVKRKKNKKTGEMEEIPVVKPLSMIYNSYFAEHPENMAGTMKFGFEEDDTYRPESIGAYPDGKNQKEMLADWVESFRNMKEEKPAPTDVEVAKSLNEKLGSDVREGSLIVNKNGEICVARLGSAVPIGVNANKVKGHTKGECIKDYNGIRKALNDVLDYQAGNSDDAGLKPLLATLNRAYDSFVRKYGNISRNTSISFLRNDVDFASIMALENVHETGDKSGKRIITVNKSDVFKGRVISPKDEVEITNVADGIKVSLFDKGYIDPQYIADKIGTNVDDVRNDILDNELGYEDPISGNILVSYDYLSGNVREKLYQAEQNNTDGRYDKNIKALRNALPMEVPPHLIDCNIGSSWIPTKYFSDFIKDYCGVECDVEKVDYLFGIIDPRGMYREKNKETGVYSEAFAKWILGTELVMAAMNNRTVDVSRVERHYDGRTETVHDKGATQECANKISDIKQDFKTWMTEKMQSDENAASEIRRIYNDQFNNFVPKSIPEDLLPVHFDGSVHELSGRPFELYPHQKKAVIKAMSEPILFAHEVGTGKTYTLITTAMEMRRLGIAKKPMVVVQNSTIGQFVSSARAIYPTARILTISDVDRNTEGRKNFYAKIKYNDWDMIVVPQSVFNSIPDSKERKIEYIQSKIEEKMRTLEAMEKSRADWNAKGAKKKEIEDLQKQLAEIVNGVVPEQTKKRSAKDEAKIKENAKVKAEEMLDRKVDDVEDFDSMGIDALLVDEAHEYKKLGFETMLSRVKGVDTAYSQKAQGLFLKVQSVLENNNGHNVVFATGTPISNTAAETYTFLKYLLPQYKMEENGMAFFDDFSRNFGNVSQMLEFTTSGKFKENTRFAGYTNLPELNRIWLSIADTVLSSEAADVKAKLPELEADDNGVKKEKDIFLPQTRTLRSVMKSVRDALETFENMSGKEKKANSHIPLTMYGIAQKAAIDPRLVLYDAVDEPNSKTNQTVEETLKALEDSKDYKGTVAIFCDNYQNKASGFNIYEEVKRKLVERGVPEDQIVIMKSTMSDNVKEKTFEKVNSGEVRVILGSTQLLGVGVNIQERLFCEIHMDVPNRPMDYQQRLGRILRQGNLHKQWGIPVRILRMGVEDSLDVTGYQRLDTKAKIVNSIMRGKKYITDNQSERNIEEDEESFDNVVAQLSGSEAALALSKAERDLRKYEGKLSQWRADQIYVANAIPTLEGKINSGLNLIENLKQDLAKIKEAFPNGKNEPFTIGSKTFDDDAARFKYLKDFVGKRQNDIADRLRDLAIKGMLHRGNTQAIHMADDKSQVIVEVAGHEFLINTEFWNEYNSRDGKYVIHRDMRIVSPDFNIDTKVNGGSIYQAIEDIESMIEGEGYTDRIEGIQNAIERYKSELEVVKGRLGKDFEFYDELEKAKSDVEELREKMKAEMAEKEAKYREIDAEIEGADIATAVESEEDSEEEEDGNEFMIRTEGETPGTVADSEAVQMATDAVMQMLDDAGLDVVMRSQEEAQEKAFEQNPNTELMAVKRALDNLTKAEHFISESINGKLQGKSFTIYLPQHTRQMIKRVMGEDFENHDITANSIRHAKKNHGENGVKNTTNSIPLRDEDFALAPYIMTAPTRIEQGNVDTIGRKSIRFVSELSNGYVVVVEKEQKNSPDDMETITMWAEMSEGGADARRSTSPAIDVRNVISNIDAANIRKNAETAIMKDVKNTSDIQFSIRKNPAPKKTGIGYKVFFRGKDGKLYPPMVANPNGADTPVGVWLDADAAPVAGESKTGRPQVKAGGKGTQGGSGQLAYRPGWHLGEIPYALQFNRKDENGDRTLFPKDFVWAEVEYADDVDYQNEAESYGYTENGKYRHSYAGLPRVPENGSYRYRTNPNPETDPWIITGAMKVNRVLTNEEVDDLVRKAGREPQRRELMVRPNGIVYGWSDGEKIYLTPEGMNPEAPLHEYTHLWARAVQKNNPDLWENVKDIMKGLPMWREVMNDAAYSDIWDDEDRVASEVLSRFSGQRNAGRILDEAEKLRQEAESSNDPFVKADKYSLIKRLKDIVKRFWNWVGKNLFDIKKFDSAEEVADRVLYDLVEQTDLKLRKSEKIEFSKQSRRLNNLAGKNGINAMMRQVDEDRKNGVTYRMQPIVESTVGGTNIAENYPATARAIYESRINRAMFVTKAAWQDSMLALKEFQGALAEATGRPISDVENTYIKENRLSSMNRAEMDEFENGILSDLVGTVLLFADKKRMSESERIALNTYMFAKHGLERNEVFARRDAQNAVDEKYDPKIQMVEKMYDEGLIDEDERDAQIDSLKQKKEDEYDVLYENNRKKDYSGLTSLFPSGDTEETGADAVADSERQAEEYVNEFEGKHGSGKINSLWTAVRKATDFSIDKQYEGGMISTDTYNYVKGMFSYYIPLRGFDETTAEEVYDYFGEVHSPFQAVYKTAKGRKSLASDPIANIANMGENSISSANRNRLVKQSFLTMVNNHKSDIASVSDLWLHRTTDTNGLDVWVPVYPEIAPEDDERTIDRKVAEFNDAMRKHAENNDPDWARSKDKPNIPYRIVNKRNENEHIVVAKVNGEPKVIIINGNPAVAQAVNGMTNPEVTKNVVAKTLEDGVKFMSSAATSRNPEFILANLSRDGIYTNSMVEVKEGREYANKYHKNWAYSLKNVYGLLLKYKSGQLYMSNPEEKMFYDFIINGGETGYTFLKDVRTWRDEIDHKLGNKRSVTLASRQALEYYDKAFDTFNRWAEGVSRYAAFKTSMEMGRSLDRSIWDAKEISVNFNKKGGGESVVGSNASRFDKVSAGFAQGFRNWYMFANAGIQGVDNFFGAITRNKAKAASMLSAYFGIGFFAPVLSMALANMLGGDDDDKYMNLPEYVRQNNLCLYIGNDIFITIPLPIELRAIYGLGELFGTECTGRTDYPIKQLLFKSASSLAQVLPLDPTEGGGNVRALLPSVIRPLAEVYENESWSGYPIWKKSYGQNDPTTYLPYWRRSTYNTSEVYKQPARLWNELMGGNDYKKNGVIDFNPAAIQHIIEGYTGGLTRVPSKLLNTVSMIWNEDKRDLRNIPIVSRFLSGTDENAERKAVDNMFFDVYKPQMDEIHALYKAYEKNELGNADTESLKTELENSLGYKKYKEWHELEKQYSRAKSDEMSQDSLTAIRKMMVDIARAGSEEELDSMKKVFIPTNANDIFRVSKPGVPKAFSK